MDPDENKDLTKKRKSARSQDGTTQPEENSSDVKSDVTPSDVTPSDVRSSDVTPSDVTPSDVTPSDVRSSDVTPSDVTPSAIRPSPIRPSDVRPSDVTPSDATPSDVTPSDVTPSDVTPSDVTPSAITPSHVTPSDVRPSDDTPSDVTPSDVTPSDVTPSNVTPSGVTPIHIRSNDTKLPDTKLTEMRLYDIGSSDLTLSIRRPRSHLIVAQQSDVRSNQRSGNESDEQSAPRKSFLKMVFGDKSVELPSTRKTIEGSFTKDYEPPEDEPEIKVIRPKKGKAYFSNALQGNRECMHSMLPFRCLFAFLAAVSIAIIYGLKVNMSIVIVAMVNHTKAKDHMLRSKTCPKPEDEDDVPDGPFAWSSVDQGHILSAYFYGYMPSQIPGAIMAERFSALWVMFAAVLVNIIAAALTPTFAYKLGMESVIALRVIQGIAGGLTFPAMHVMLSKWAPASLRSIFSGIVYSGIAIGMVGSVLIGGYVSHAVGWEWTFYIMAILSFPWCIVWPCWITEAPPDYIARHEEQPRFPIKEAFKSIPFWAIIVAHFCGNSGLYMVITESPTFLKKVLYMNMKENASFSAIPYLLMYVVSVSLGTALDYLRREKITTTIARKIGAIVAMALPGCCLVGMTFIGCSVKAGLVVFTLAVAFIGAQTTCYLSNHLDISPTHAGMLMGISNTIATIPGMVIPPLVGLLTHSDESLERWSIAFYTIAALYFGGFIFYFICASGARQPWDSPPERS